MGYSISGTTITLIRGDTFIANISLCDSNDVPYIPNEGDKLRFAMKTNYSDLEPCLIKEIPIDTMKLVLDPIDTEGLAFGTYVYDIQLTTEDGRVDTVISKAKFKLTEEVD